MALGRITALFTCRPDCPTCRGVGTVCENHPDRPWGDLAVDGGGCSCGAGAPCPDRFNRDTGVDVPIPGIDGHDGHDDGPSAA